MKLPKLYIRTFVLTDFFQNTRILIDESTRNAVVIDPGGESEILIRAIEEGEYNVESIWLTHSHIDHVGGVQSLLDYFKSKGRSVSVLGHRAEQQFREAVELQAQYFGLPSGRYLNSPEPTRYIDEGDLLSLGEINFEVFFTPGHSPGHLVFYLANAEYELSVEGNINKIERFPRPQSPLLIAGDTVFAGSIGRTDLPGGDSELLLESIRQKILTLPPATLILPGHGPETTVGAEQSSNPFLSRS
jgi:hydroxyacylglutathione hydrolase